MANAELGARLKQSFENRTEDKILYVKAHKDLQYGKVLDALDIAAHNNVTVTGMITDQRPGTISAVGTDNLLNAPAASAGGKSKRACPPETQAAACRTRETARARTACSSGC